MAKFLPTVLSTEDPLFLSGLQRLEQATGNSGVDTRLIADITHKAHDIMRQIGLDPADSTFIEVYGSLLSTVGNGTAEKLLLDTDYVVFHFDGNIVSFNLIDVIENAHHELSYNEQTVSHGQRSLRGEIVQRYLDHARTDETTTKEIAASMGLLPESDSQYESTPHLVENQANDRPYLLAIGDIVTDAFIALREDEAQITTDENGGRRLSMEFGSKLPYDHVDIIQAVGNSANAAVSFARLGLNAGLLAFIGGDQAGKDSLAYLQSEKINTELVSVQQDQKSNYHYALRDGAERTILIKYENYAYAWEAPSQVPEWIYLSMLSNDSWQLHVDLLDYLNEHLDVKLAFQPGTFHFEWGTEKLAGLYARTHFVIMNKEEAALVTGKSTSSVRELINALHELGPKVVIVTDGPAGAYASADYKLLFMPNYPDPKPPYDRTGAGDAFASTIVAALAKGESIETALRWAPINSMSVVQVLGAQAGLLRPDELQKYLDDAPEDYFAKEYTE
jgi:sugar/nucleoside kinase (ribokinase family)